MKAPKNPFRRWLETQPRDVTQTSIAKLVCVDRSYISDLMSETSAIYPSLQLAFRIEQVTKGKVTARMLHDFAASNRAAESDKAA
jgi:transcriptional regulator with XRE-family HTH domain